MVTPFLKRPASPFNACFDYREQDKAMEKIIFVLFSQEILGIYQRMLDLRV